jgi:hypothetical protein
MYCTDIRLAKTNENQEIDPYALAFTTKKQMQSLRNTLLLFKRNELDTQESSIRKSAYLSLLSRLAYDWQRLMKLSANHDIGKQLLHKLYHALSAIPKTDADLTNEDEVKALIKQSLSMSPRDVTQNWYSLPFARLRADANRLAKICPNTLIEEIDQISRETSLTETCISYLRHADNFEEILKNLLHPDSLYPEYLANRLSLEAEATSNHTDISDNPLQSINITIGTLKIFCNQIQSFADDLKRTQDKKMFFILCVSPAVTLGILTLICVAYALAGIIAISTHQQFEPYPSFLSLWPWLFSFAGILVFGIGTCVFACYITMAQRLFECAYTVNSKRGMNTHHKQSLDGLVLILENCLDHFDKKSQHYATVKALYEQLQNKSDLVEDLLRQLTSLKQAFSTLAEDLDPQSPAITLKYSRQICFYPPPQADIYALLPNNIKEKEQTIIEISNLSNLEEKDDNSLLSSPQAEASELSTSIIIDEDDDNLEMSIINRNDDADETNTLLHHVFSV